VAPTSRGLTPDRRYSSGYGRCPACGTDPLRGSLFNPQSLNRYTYVLNSPTNLIDPLGLDTCVNTVLPDGTIYTVCTVTATPDSNADLFLLSLVWGFLFEPHPGFPKHLADDTREPNRHQPARQQPSRGTAFASRLGTCLQTTLSENLGAFTRDLSVIAKVSGAVGVGVTAILVAEFPAAAPLAPVIAGNLTINTFLTFGASRLVVLQAQNVVSTAGCAVFTAKNTLGGS